MRLIAAIAFVCLSSAFAQEGQTVALSQAKSSNATQIVYGYTGTNLVYACYGKSIINQGIRAQNKGSISAATNANPVSFTSTAHGFDVNSRPLVTISGGSGNWTAINGQFTATIVDANTFTIPVDSTAFGAFAGTITYTTTAPRKNIAEWQVVVYKYDGSNNLIWSGFLNGTAGFTQKCTDATLTTTNQQ